MAAISMACISSQCLSLSTNFKTLSLSSSPSSFSSTLSLNSSLTLSANLCHSYFSRGYQSLPTIRRPQTFSVVCEAATQNKADSAAKRFRQSETRRLRNKARKSEVRTRMKKVLQALLKLKKKKTGAVPEEIIPIETMIAEAYSAIDKAVVKGVLHRNTGANRKSRLARNKTAVEIHHGWYKPGVDPTSA